MDGTLTFEDIVLSKLDKIDEDTDEIRRNVTDLCVRLSVMENSYKTHIDEQIHSADKKYKMIAVVFGVISAVSTIANFAF